MSSSTFTEQDVQILDDFGKLLAEKAEFRLSVSDSIRLVKYLNGINAIRKKVAENILEYRRIIEAEQNSTERGE